MIFRYLGTAAAEGWPALFCECDNCMRAQKAGGRNIRKRSQALIDGRLLIDFPPDTYASTLQIGMTLANVHTLIFTHSHSDHLYVKDLVMRGDVFAHFEDKTPLSIYGTKEVLAEIERIEGDINRWGRNTKLFELHEIHPLDTFTSDGYTITALPADHDKSSGPVIYSITDGEKSVLYAHDTGYFLEPVWDYFKTLKKPYDFVSLDCTNITLPWRTGHMGIEADVDVAQKMRDMGVADDNTHFCVNHFSHNGGKTYDELVPIMEEYGMSVSFDSMTIEV